MVAAVTERGDDGRERVFDVYDATTIRRWVRGCADEIAANRDFLTQLDAAIGDADHGINMDRGFSAAVTDLDATSDLPAGELLIRVGGTLIYRVGRRGRTAVRHVSAPGRGGVRRRRVVRRRGPAEGAARRPRWHPGAGGGGGRRQDDRRRLRAGARGVRAGAAGRRRRGHGVPQRRPRPRARACVRRCRCRRARAGPRTSDRGAWGTRIRGHLDLVPVRVPSHDRWTVVVDRFGTASRHDPVGRARARILKVLGTGTSRMGVTEVAERLGLAKGTAYGLLRTLEAQELVEQDPETDKYRLGPAMLQLGNAFLDNHELRARSLLWADSLASRGRRRGARRGVARVERADRASRVPPRQLGADPRGGRLDPVARVRSGQGHRWRTCRRHRAGAARGRS